MRCGGQTFRSPDRGSSWFCMRRVIVVHIPGILHVMSWDSGSCWNPVGVQLTSCVQATHRFPRPLVSRAMGCAESVQCHLDLSCTEPPRGHSGVWGQCPRARPWGGPSRP